MLMLGCLKGQIENALQLSRSCNNAVVSGYTRQSAVPIGRLHAVMVASNLHCR
jgi:hypothetical protein